MNDNVCFWFQIRKYTLKINALHYASTDISDYFLALFILLSDT